MCVCGSASIFKPVPIQFQTSPILTRSISCPKVKPRHLEVSLDGSHAHALELSKRGPAPENGTTQTMNK